MAKPETTLRMATLIAAAGIALAPVSCKNSDTLTGPPSATATPATRTATPGVTTPTPLSATPTPAPSGTPTPAPTAASQGLSGAWHGTVKYLDSDWWFPCSDPAVNGDSVTATISQTDSSITARIHFCTHDAQFQGTLDSGRLTGTMNLVTGPYSQTGSSSGSASTSQIQLSTPSLVVTPSPCLGDTSCQVGGFNISLSR
jgi:hypothetical protein